MRSKCKFIFILVLSLVFMLSLVKTANAASGGGATVTPVSGDGVFTVSSVPVLQLPGQTTTASGLVVPSGFPAGEKQFEGSGVTISGLSYGTAKACFPITALNQGWGGKVGYWDGSVWKLLDTSISTPEEGTFSWACATVSNNGTYALLSWVVDASKLVKAKPVGNVCSFADEYRYGSNYGFTSPSTIGMDIFDSSLLGTTVNYKIISVDPEWEGHIISGSTGTTTVFKDTYVYRAWFNDDFIVFSTPINPAFTARITFPSLGCYIDLDFLVFGEG